jgi:Fe-S-cluster containining protein
MEMAENRRRVEADEARIADGLNALAPNADELVSLIRVIRDKVQTSVERHSVEPLMAFVYDNLTAGTRSVENVPIACGRGCAFCCMNTWIEVTAPEVIFTVKNLPEAQRERATEAVLRACSRTEGITLEERVKLAVPCPLLEQGVCSIYQVRPVACRLAVSADSEVCRRSFLEHSGEGIPVPAPWGPLRQGYRVALEAALLNAGLDWNMTEWNSALRSVLEDEGVEAAWLRGERVLAQIQRLHRPSFFQTPSWASLYVEAFGEPPPVT